MRAFGKLSQERLAQCDEKLQLLFETVLQSYDCTVLCGHRGEAEQEEAFRTGKSKVHFPNSKHNTLPSKAVDVVPYPIDWNDTKRFMHFAGFVQGVAASLGVKIRWGGDFNQDLNFKNDSFIDMPHFELVEEDSNADSE